MASKRRKKKSRPKLSAAQLYRPEVKSATMDVKGAVSPKGAVTLPSGIPTEEELAEEYRYVLTDLRKIAWLALAMLVLLVALAFIIV